MITNEDKTKIDRMLEIKISRKDIGTILNIPKSTLSDYIIGKTHKIDRYLWQEDPLNFEDRVVGVIPDLHAPSQVVGALDFLINTFKKRGVNTIVCTGDIVDLHRASRFRDEQDALNFRDELTEAKKFIKVLIEVFPYCKLCTSNHDSRNITKAKEYGIDINALKSFSEYIGLPEDTWEIKDHFMIDGVKYCHKSRNGVHGVYNAGKELGGSLVSAHTHVNGGVRYLKNMYGSYFCMDVGCLIDDSTYNMRYARELNGGLTLGCGVVYNRRHAEYIPMYIPMINY